MDDSREYMADILLNDTPMPEWAVGRAYGELTLGAHLPTRDGRLTGNAHIISILSVEEQAQHVHKRYDMYFPIYTILTDAGNTLGMSAREIERLFHEPEWVSDVDEVIRKFGRGL